jgi:hypothetical protein
MIANPPYAAYRDGLSLVSTVSRGSGFVYFRSHFVKAYLVITERHCRSGTPDFSCSRD